MGHGVYHARWFSVAKFCYRIQFPVIQIPDLRDEEGGNIRRQDPALSDLYRVNSHK